MYTSVCPKQADHAALARLVPTEPEQLVSILSATDDTCMAVLVDILAKLESVQIGMAKLKSLGAEEEEVATVDECLLLKSDLGANSIGAAMMQIGMAVKGLTTHIGYIPSDKLQSEVFKKYNLVDMANRLEALRQE